MTKSFGNKKSKRGSKTNTFRRPAPTISKARVGIHKENSPTARNAALVAENMGLHTDVYELQVVRRTARSVAEMKESVDIYPVLLAMGSIGYVHKRMKDNDEAEGVSERMLRTFAICAMLFGLSEVKLGIGFITPTGVEIFTGRGSASSAIRMFAEKGWVEAAESVYVERVVKTMRKRARTSLFVKKMTAGSVYVLTEKGRGVAKSIMAYQIELMDMAAYLAGDNL